MAQGLVVAKSNAALDAEAAARSKADEQASQSTMLSITHFVRSKFQAAKSHKDRFITPRLLQCQRQKAGEYDPDTLKRIVVVGGCRDFFNISETKTDALESWIVDITTNAGEMPFAVLPTPVVDLKDDRKDTIVSDMVESAALAAEATGSPMTPEEVYEATAKAFDDAIEDQFQQAKQQAAGMERKMRDQLLEGGWQTAFDEFVQDYAQYPTAILKGPMLVRKRQLCWGDDQTASVEEKLCYQWERVSPHRWFPGPNIATPDQGYCCELKQYSRAGLGAMVDSDGWNGAQIRGVLASPDAALSVEQSASAATQAELEGRDMMYNSGAASDQVWAIEYHGMIAGAELMEFGLRAMADGAALDPLQWYSASAVIVGPYCVRCLLNPNPLGMSPYKVASFVRVPGTVWGRSMVEKMTDAQKGYNSVSRQMMNALAEASRPRSVIDMDALAEGCSPDDCPGKQFRYNGNKLTGTGQNRKPVDFFQPKASIDVYLKARESFEKDADNRTLVPRYVHGQVDVGGAGETASGLNMLMGAAHKGIKRSLAHIDRGTIQPHMQDLYTRNILYLPDDEWGHIKGDCKIEARGALHLLFKEVMMQRHEQFLQQTANPTDQQIIGIEGRAAVLRVVAERLDLPVDEVVPDRQTLLQRVRDDYQRQLQDNSQELEQGGGVPSAGALQQVGAPSAALQQRKVPSAGALQQEDVSPAGALQQEEVVPR